MNTKLPTLFSALALGLALGLACCLPASAAEIRLPQTGAQDLVLDVPTGWWVTVEAENSSSMTLSLKSKEPQVFMGLLTVLRLPEGKAPPNDARIRSYVEQTAEATQDQAVEKTIAIESLGESGSSGYFFSVTDRKPKAGEFKYMTQGSMALDRLVLTFTALSNQEPERYKADMLAMVKGAKVAAAPPMIAFTARNGGPALTLPRGDWELRQEKHNHEGKSAYYLLHSDQLDVTFSVWVEVNKRCSSAETCLALALENVMYKKRLDQKQIDDADLKATSFFLAPSSQIPEHQFNVLASAYVDGYWVDVHISNVGRKGPPDPAAVLAALHSLQLR